MKKSGLKKVYLSLSSIFIFILHIPLVFAKSNPFYEIKQLPAQMGTTAANDTLFSVTKIKIHDK